VCRYQSVKDSFCCVPYIIVSNPYEKLQFKHGYHTIQNRIICDKLKKQITVRSVVKKNYDLKIHSIGWQYYYFGFTRVLLLVLVLLLKVMSSSYEKYKIQPEICQFLDSVFRNTNEVWFEVVKTLLLFEGGQAVSVLGATAHEQVEIWLDSLSQISQKHTFSAQNSSKLCRKLPTNQVCSIVFLTTIIDIAKQYRTVQQGNILKTSPLLFCFQKTEAYRTS
jgi:hypothetical protein